MDNTEMDWREKLRDLARQLLEVEENGSLEELKIRCGELYEALVILHHQQSKQGMTAEPAQSLSEEKESAPEDIEKAVMPTQKIDSEAEVNDERSIELQAQEEQEEEQAQEEEYPTLSDLFVPTFGEIKEDMSQKEEFKDTVSLEETEKLFNTPREEARQLSLNDKLVSNRIYFGLNDRIAFVNKLFNFSQSDFTKVVDRINTMNSLQEANHYIQYQVKKTYNWKGKEDLEERFMEIVERKFMS